MSVEATEADHEAEEPVNDVYLSSMRQFHIPECVICGEEHWHGSMDPTVANGGRSHRVEHCNYADHRGGYYLQLAEDADPPARWYDWVDRNTAVDVVQEGER